MALMPVVKAAAVAAESLLVACLRHCSGSAESVMITTAALVSSSVAFAIGPIATVGRAAVTFTNVVPCYCCFAPGLAADLAEFGTSGS